MDVRGYNKFDEKILDDFTEKLQTLYYNSLDYMSYAGKKDLSIIMANYNKKIKTEVKSLEIMEAWEKEVIKRGDFKFKEEKI